MEGLAVVDQAAVTRGVVERDKEANQIHHQEISTDEDAEGVESKANGESGESLRIEPSALLTFSTYRLFW